MEIDELAARSHAINFCRGKSEAEIELHARPRDITRMDPEELTKELGLGSPSRAIDVIIGGPPCQAYARVGRAKLREIAEHPQAFKIDPRANLYLRYLRYVERLKPLALLMENVPDILNHGGHNIVQEIVEALDVMGYEARYSLINSAHHGVPQMRDRVMMIAFHRSLGAAIRFPSASHRCELPKGYEGTRAVALKYIDLFSGSAYVEPGVGGAHLPPAVTSAEAIGDLPPITLHREGKLKRGARRFTELLPYRQDARLSDFAREMRSWLGFEAGKGIYDHVLRYLPRDTTIFEAMQQGDEYPAAHRVANRLFEEEARRRRVARNSAEWKRCTERWYRHTIQASSQTGGGSFARTGPHGRSWRTSARTLTRTSTMTAQGRVITVREAARLQSFPDGFIFAGTMNPAFRQIGNAVPPIMAREVAKVMMESLAVAQGISQPTLIAAE